MDKLQFVVILLILLGAVTIFLSAFSTSRLIRMIPPGGKRENWKILFCFMLLFGAGYIGAALLILSKIEFPLELLMSLIFFFGAGFVFLTVRSGRKTIEELLHTTVSKSYVEAIIKSMADSLIVIDTDKDATIRTVNNAALNLLDFPEEEIVGKPAKLIIDGNILNQITIDALKHIDKITDVETTCRAKGGLEIPISLSASTLRNLRGEIEGIIYVAQDIRERKESELKIQKYMGQLRDSEAKLRELNASKDKFFSIIAHDLRNPFGAVLGYAEILYTDAETLAREEIREYSNYVFSQSKTIYDLLENLLTWSRMQTGRMNFNPQNIEMKSYVCMIRELYEPVAAKKNITLICDVQKQVLVYADKDMLATILRNLTSNAIKFTPSGGTVTLLLHEKDAEFIEVCVTDTGVGMSDETLSKLFRIDVHHSTAGTNKEEGTGLGLILCRELVVKNGGEIRVESKPGSGSTFRFTIPRSVT